MADDPPRLPGLCLEMTAHVIARGAELGRLLKSLAHVPPDRHDQAMAIYSQALLEHGYLMAELNQLSNHMAAARIAKLVKPVTDDVEEPVKVPVPCRPPPQVPLMSQPMLLVLESEPGAKQFSGFRLKPDLDRWTKEEILNARRCSGERGED